MVFGSNTPPELPFDPPSRLWHDLSPEKLHSVDVYAKDNLTPNEYANWIYATKRTHCPITGKKLWTFNVNPEFQDSLSKPDDDRLIPF